MLETAVTPAGDLIQKRTSRTGKISLIKVILLAGMLFAMASAAWDYRTALTLRAEMRSSAELALRLTGKMAHSLPPGAIEIMPATVFKTAFDHPELKDVSVWASYDPKSGLVSIRSSAVMPIKLLRLLGIARMDLRVAASSVLPSSESPG